MMRAHRHCVYALSYHLVFCTKYRRKCLTAGMVWRLEQIVREQGAKWDIAITEFGAEQDHVHILLDAHPSVEPAKFVNSLKTVTSRLLRKEYAKHLACFYWGKPVLWSRSYCLLSAGGAPLETLKAYIQSQDTPVQ